MIGLHTLNPIVDFCFDPISPGLSGQILESVTPKVRGYRIFPMSRPLVAAVTFRTSVNPGVKRTLWVIRNRDIPSLLSVHPPFLPFPSYNIRLPPTFPARKGYRTRSLQQKPQPGVGSFPLLISFLFFRLLPISSFVSSFVVEDGVLSPIRSGN